MSVSRTAERSGILYAEGRDSSEKKADECPCTKDHYFKNVRCSCGIYFKMPLYFDIYANAALP